MNGVTTFHPSSSMETPITARPLVLYLSANSMYQGISSLHPWHQVAQKLSSTTLPFRSERLTGVPFSSFSENAGAALRAAVVLISAGAVSGAHETIRVSVRTQAAMRFVILNSPVLQMIVWEFTIFPSERAVKTM